MPPLLEVVALHPADAEQATAGGADRLQVCSDVRAETDTGLSPQPSMVSAIRRATHLPVRVLLRLNEGFVTTGAELVRLQRLAESYLSAGADGFVLGFLTPDNDIDAEAIAVLTGCFPGIGWTFHRAIDHVLAADRAWRELPRLAGLDQVLSAGSVRGVTSGLDELLRRARDPRSARLLMAGGGLVAEQVPWLLAAGIGAYQVGAAVRVGGSWTRGSVDAGFVRSWRRLLDAEAVRGAVVDPDRPTGVAGLGAGVVAPGQR